MRVCDLTTLYVDGGEGGVNTYLLEKARYLTEKLGPGNHAIIVPGERDEKLQLFGSTVYKIRSPRLPSEPGPESRVLIHFSRIQKILREEAPSVVEVDNSYFLGRVAASAVRGRNVPIVGFCHVHLPLMARLGAANFTRLLPGVAESLAWGYVRLCSTPLDRLMVSTPSLARRMKDRGFSRLEYVPLGVNLDLFRPRPRARASGTSILAVGRLSPEKSFDVLIDAFKLLATRGDYRLTIVGDGPARAALERRAGNDPRIAFLGLRPHGDELARIYATSDVFVNPSTNECFGLAILEALASGVPVVAVKQGGPLHLVRPGVGMLAEAGDPADLADKTEAVARTSESSRDECRRHVESCYSWERTFDRILDVYQDAIDCARQGRRRPAASLEPAVAR